MTGDKWHMWCVDVCDVCPGAEPGRPGGVDHEGVPSLGQPKTCW